MPIVRPGSGAGGEGAYSVYNKETNGQPAVFTSETDRDNYFSTNPSELDNINNQQFAVGVGTIAEDPSSDNVSQWYIYSAGTWVTIVATLVGATGLDGDAATVANLNAGEIPVKSQDTEELVASGMIVIPETNQVLAPTNFGVQSGSIDFGDLITLSEAGGFGYITNRVTGATFTLVDFFSPRTAPSNNPQIFQLQNAETEYVIQPDDSTQITDNQFSYIETTTLSARSNSFILRTFAPMSNLRVKVTDTASGVAFKYLPDKSAWLSGEGGYDFVTGDNTVDLLDSPLPLEVGRQLTLEFQADNMTLLGNALGEPFFKIMAQLGEFKSIPLSEELPPPVEVYTELSSDVVTFVDYGDTPTVAFSETVPSDGDWRIIISGARRIQATNRNFQYELKVNGTPVTPLISEEVKDSANRMPLELNRLIQGLSSGDTVTFEFGPSSNGTNTRIYSGTQFTMEKRR